MASCATPQWSTSYTPQAVLTVTQTASTDTTVTLSWTLQYVTHGYAASTNGLGRAYTVTIAGSTVKSGSFDINGRYTTTIASGTKTINKTTSAQTISFGVSFYFDVTWTGVYGGTKTASGSISVAAKTSYAVKYNANGGSGAPGNQTKWHGTSLTLSTTKPTRTGYTFQGWATSSTGSVKYASGATYTANAAVTLYAVWKAVTYSVTYNANGGTGAPGKQTKTYGVTLKLSTIKPTRTNYNFKGWGTSANATTVSYAAGASYTNNSAITLYAIWELAYTKPRITDFSIERCDANGVTSDEGTNALVIFKWACDKAVSSITIHWKLAEADTYTSSATISASGTSGSVNKIVGSDLLDTDHSYDFLVTVADTVDSTPKTSTLVGMKFTFDLLGGGNGAAFGKPAELDGVLDIGFMSRFLGGVYYVELEPKTDLNNLITPGFYVGDNVSTYSYGNCPTTSGTFTLEIAASGFVGQVRQTLQICHKTSPTIYERYYYGSSWGAWYEVGPTKSAITVGITDNTTLGVVNTYTQIPFNRVISTLIGGLTLTENYIKVGAGVRHVRISGQTRISCGTVAGNRHGRICKNSNGTVSPISWINVKMVASDQDALVFTPVIVSVSEGDLLYMTFYTPDSTDFNVSGSSGNGYQTYLTVESI